MQHQGRRTPREDGGKRTQLVGFCLGFLLLVNFYIRPLGEHTRILDLMPVIGVGYLAFAVTRNRRPLFVAALLLLVLLSSWLVADWIELGAFAPVYSTRWLILTPLGTVICVITEKREARLAFASGMLIGAATCSGLLWLQLLGFSDSLISLGLAYPSTREFLTMANAPRYSGLGGHPNGAAAMVSLAIPAALAVSAESRTSKNYLIVAALLVCIPALLATYTRSAFLVSIAVVAVWVIQSLFSNTKRKMAVGYAALGLVLIVCLSVFSQNIVDRFVNDRTSDRNADGRFSSNQEALSFLAESPLGYGSNVHEYILPGSAHNAFEGLALFGGVPIATLVFLSILRSALRIRHKPDLEVWIALHVLGLAFFEEHFTNPTFITLGIWLTLTAVSSWLRTVNPDQANTRLKERRTAAGGAKYVAMPGPKGDERVCGF